MAIAVRAVAVGNTGTTGGTGDVGITIAVPTGTVNGDVMYMGVFMASSTGTWVTPGGGSWTVVEAQFASTGQASAKMAVYRKVAASEPASYTVTWGAAANTGRAAGIIASFSGVNQTTPQQAEAKDAGAGPTSTEVLPSVTATSATLLLGIVGAYTPAFGATTWTADGAMTEITGADTSSANTTLSNASVEMATQVIAAGATGTRTATGSRADLRPGGVMVALNPAISSPLLNRNLAVIRR